MKEDNILIDFHPNDYIIRLSPFVDEKGNWTGELMVGTISTEDNVMSDNDHYQLMHLTQMVCASIPAMEESEETSRSSGAWQDSIYPTKQLFKGYRITSRDEQLWLSWESSEKD